MAENGEISIVHSGYSSTTVYFKTPRSLASVRTTSPGYKYAGCHQIFSGLNITPPDVPVKINDAAGTRS